MRKAVRPTIKATKYANMVAAIAIIAHSSFAGNALAVNVLTQVQDERARILFNWQNNVAIIPSIVGNQLSIQFDKDEKINVNQLLSSLTPYIVNASQPNSRQIILTMNAAYVVQAFSDGKANGVDLLLNGDGKSAKKTSRPDDKTIIDAQKGEVTTDKSILTTDPTKLRPNKNITPPINPILTTKPPIAEQKGGSLLKDNSKEANKALANTKDAVAPNTQAKIYALADKLSQGKMVVAVKKTPISVDFFFPFHKRVAASSFQYGGDLFMVFSDAGTIAETIAETIDVDNLASILPSFISEIEQIYHKNATILRLKGQLGTGLYTKATQTEKGYEWRVQAMRRPQLPENILLPELVSTQPIKPHIFVNALQLAQEITFEHPVSGEKITVLPSYASSSGVFPERITTDLTMLRTGQGVAFVANEDDLRVMRLRQGIRITKIGGLSISTAMKSLPIEELTSAESFGNNFLPYEKWRAADDADFALKELDLLGKISSSDERKLPALRLALLQLYMAEGLHMEALGLLDLINRTNPDFYADYQLAALSGVANFMLGRMADAERLFADATIADEDEAKLWQRALGIATGDYVGNNSGNIIGKAAGLKRNFAYFEYNKRYINSYPPAVRRKLAMLAIDNAMARKKDGLAQDILQQLYTDKLAEPLKNYTAYVQGRILAEAGDLKEAEKLLQPLADDVTDNFTRARAIFTLATNRYKAGEIDRQQLIATLEPVQLLWRGDDFELNLLNLLGELYVNNDQPLEGLRAWRDIITYFPSSDIALEVAGRMAKTFVAFFNDGLADSMTPLAALSLYYEFRDLTPIGVAGDKMVQQLADRLAGVDLLDKAAKLLEYQVTYRLDKAERSKVGAKLAQIYLLNRQPEQALQVLELTGYGANADGLNRKRNHLAAISYGKIGEWQRAVNLLRDDYSREAKFIKSDIYWDIKDWYNLAINLEDILGNRAMATDALNSEETQALLRLCVAYSFMGEAKQLAYLRDYFTPLVERKEDAQVFAFLTSATDVINRENIGRVSSEIAKMKGFLDNYLATISETKTSNIMAMRG